MATKVNARHGTNGYNYEAETPPINDQTVHGRCLVHDWSHAPGAAQRSMEGFLFNCNSLSAERAQYPCSLRGTRLKRL